MKKLVFLFSILLVALLAACNKDDVITTEPLPVIKVEGSRTYELKVGEQVVISPRVENGEDATFEWSIDGKKVGSGNSYSFKAEEVGTFYLTLDVTNSSGRAEADFRIEVLPLMPPVVMLAVGEDGVMELSASKPYTILSSVAGGDGAEYEWLLDGESMGDEPSLSVQIDQIGEYPLTLKVRNEDGSAEASATLCVVERLTPQLYFPPQNGLNVATSKRNVALGRELHLQPVGENLLSPTFSWRVDGREVVGDEVLRFRPETEGVYDIEVVATDSDGAVATTTLEVECCAEQGTYRRAPSAESQMSCNAVYEYSPAAGQFINEDKSGFNGEQSADKAAEYALARLQQGRYLSLGAWGGYVIVGFDHSIDSADGEEFIIKGNMHEGSSEAGVVWVSQDTNGNGLPDDEWYELRGSEYDAPTTWRDYAVTYYRPSGEAMDILWRDNRGESGRVARVDAHKQASYFPMWYDAPSVTLYGTRLEARTTIDQTTGNYVNSPFAWGYADNIGSDLLANDDQSNGFDIANAVTASGAPAELQYIDFVKIQSGINATAGHLGEISTEVCRIEALR